MYYNTDFLFMQVFSLAPLLPLLRDFYADTSSVNDRLALLWRGSAQGFPLGGSCQKSLIFD